MSPAIPVQNLYYLLAYAWSEKLMESELEEVNEVNCPDLATFFAHVLSQRLKTILSRGLDRSYIYHEELTSQPKGRIDFAASAKRQTWVTGKMHCGYSELSHDVPHNRIIKATLRLLYREAKVKLEVKRTLHDQLKLFSEVRDIRVTPRSFQRIQLHRNNREYKFILHICELIHASLLPEHDSEGRRKFRRIEENHKVMPNIFEKFVLEFARRHLQEAKSTGERIYWLADYHKASSASLMPTMNTDVTIEWKSGRKLILDCKYYKEAFTSRSYNEDDDAVQRFKTNNLYQIFAYIANKRPEPGWEKVEGMLLYPTTRKNFSESMTLQGGNHLQICSINLSQDWEGIEQELQAILNQEI